MGELNIDKMAARRVTATTVDWAKVASLPGSLPKIDFANYKAKIAVAGMVDDFQKKYDALKIPYPQDTYTSSIESEATSLKADYAKFVDESKTRIVGIQKDQAKWEAMMPVEEMNLEEALDAGLTKYVVDVNKENEEDMTFWPHDETYGEWKKRFEIYSKEVGDDPH